MYEAVRPGTRNKSTIPSSTTKFPAIPFLPTDRSRDALARERKAWNGGGDTRNSVANAVVWVRVTCKDGARRRSWVYRVFRCFFGKDASSSATLKATIMRQN